jgi:hypothetical protein
MTEEEDVIPANGGEIFHTVKILSSPAFVIPLKNGIQGR